MARKAIERDANYQGNKGGECNAVERLAHCLRVDFTCPYCGSDLRRVKSIHIDHVLAQVWGGGKGPKNQLACCGSCNSSKKHKLLREWAEGRGDGQIVERVQRLLKRQLPTAQAKKIMGR